MANTNSPFGFSQVGRVPGAPAPDFAQTTRLISSANTHAIFSGDLVYDLGTGYIDVAVAAGSQCLGVFLGCQYQSTSQQKIVWGKYYPGADATGDIIAYICTDPYALFLVQSTGASAVAFSDIGANIDISTATAGNTTTGVSGMAVNQAGIATTSTFPFRIWALASSNYPVQDVGAINGIDNTTPFNQVMVTFNSMALKTLTGV